MRNLLHYKGYYGSVQFDADDEIFHGRVEGIPDEILFEGNTADGLRRDFEGAVDFYLDNCRKVGKQPNKPFRGDFLVRTTPEVHQRVYLAAKAEGLSLSAWASKVLAKAAEQAFLE